MEPLLIFSFLVCTILLIIIYRKIIKFQTPKATIIDGKNVQLPQPPGSEGLPFIGEMLAYAYHIYNGVPEKFIEKRQKKYSTTVFKTSILGRSMAVLCGPEGNKFLFSNEKKLLCVWWPPVIGQLFPQKINDAHTKMRSTIVSFLKVDSLRKSVSVMDSVMKQHLLSDWETDDKIVKISHMSKKYTSWLSCKLLLNIDDLKIIDEFSKLTEVINTAVHSSPVLLPGTARYRGIKASEVMRKKLEKIVNQRRIDIGEKCSSSTVPQDMITHMLTTDENNGQFINELDIPSALLGFIEAGYASLQNTITLVIMHLSEFPDVYDSVLREQMEIAESKQPNDFLSWEDLSRMKYTWNVVSEILRLFPPLGTFRQANVDFEYAGHLIPKGFKMHWIARATHMNPEYFQDPEKFDPTRFKRNAPAPYTYIPFGGGPRMCPGTEYARLAMLIFIHNVVTKFKWEKIIPDEKIIHGAMSTPAHGLPVRLHPLKP